MSAIKKYQIQSSKKVEIQLTPITKLKELLVIQLVLLPVSVSGNLAKNSYFYGFSNLANCDTGNPGDDNEESRRKAGGPREKGTENYYLHSSGERSTENDGRREREGERRRRNKSFGLNPCYFQGPGGKATQILQ
jgi:hypothetical protein